MKFLVLFALVGVSAALVRPPLVLDGITDAFKCALCKDVCADTESWAGNEEENHEAAQIAKCEKLLGNNTFAKLFCDDIVKNSLDDLIKHMEDPNTEKEDCQKACTDINWCKQSS